MGLPADSVSDALLESLHGCTRLWGLELGREDGPQQMDITASAVTRSVSLHTTQASVYLHPGVDIPTQLYIYTLG